MSGKKEILDANPIKKIKQAISACSLKIDELKSQTDVYSDIEENIGDKVKILIDARANLRDILKSLSDENIFG